MATGICPWCGKTVDKFIMFRGDIVGCRYCGIHTKQTNADRLRAMSDEELANMINFLFVAYDLRNPAGILDWLRQEAQDG